MKKVKFAPELQKNFVSVEIAVGSQFVRGKFYGLPEPSGLAPAVVFLHGYGQNSNRKSWGLFARQCVEAGIAGLAIDYRGFGDSDGDFKEATIADMYQDALAGYDYLAQHPKVDVTRIGIVGSSAGAYLAAIVAGERAVKTLVLSAPALYRDDWLEQTIDGIPDADKTQFRQAGDLNTTKPIMAMRKFTGSLLVLPHEKDEQMPPRVGRAYYEAATPARDRQLCVLEGVGHIHNEASRKRFYELALKELTTAL